MRKLLIAVMLTLLFITPARALEFSAPTVPESGAAYLPEQPDTFAEGLWTILKEAIGVLQPAVKEASRICVGIIGSVILVSVIKSFPGATESVVDTVGVLFIATILLQPSHALISLGAETVKQISDYGKLLMPVMTAALASQGGITASASMYAGTVFFDSILSSLTASLIVPMIYIYLCLAAANSALGEEILEKLRNFVKWLMTWSLKIILYVFTGFISITGVVNGTADAAALKATKLTISGMVPVVGNILSDASEAVLVSASVMKNAAGIYGILALIALWIEPFLRIGVQYMLLKLTEGVCGVFGSKKTVKLIGAFSGAMGLLLSMTGTVCLMLLISTVCFMKGVG